MLKGEALQKFIRLLSICMLYMLTEVAPPWFWLQS